jgi:hypothetical protein
VEEKTMTTRKHTTGRFATFLIALCGVVAIAGLMAANGRDAGRGQTRATVYEFGAVGDGRADDTAAIQRAVDAGAGDVIFPRGIYRITRPIVADLDRVGFTALLGHGTARIVMAGPGPAIRLIGTHEGTASPGTVKPNVWESQRMPVVDAIEIVGAHDEACGIEALGTMKLTVSRVLVRNALHAIHLVKRNRNVIVSGCHLYKNRGVGLYLDDVNLHQINVIGCHISYNDGGGVVSRAGNVRNLHLTGCDIEGNMSREGPPTANVLIDCSGGGAGTAEVAVVGCTIQHTYLGPDSANIRMIGSDEQDRRWGHITIGNNVLSDAQINVDVARARGVTLTGNTFWQGHQYDIRVVDSSNVVLGSNSLDRNPNYVWSNSRGASHGVLLQSCQDVTVTGLHVSGVRHTPAGVQLESCRRVNITGCTILDCENAGLLLKNVCDSRVSDCLIRNDLPEREGWQPVAIVGVNNNVVVQRDKDSK